MDKTCYRSEPSENRLSWMARRNHPRGRDAVRKLALECLESRTLLAIGAGASLTPVNLFLKHGRQELRKNHAVPPRK